MATKQSKPNQRENMIVLVVIGFFCLFGVAGWITTSWYQNDLKLSQVFYKGMDYPFIKAWTSFTICDGYEGIVTFILPMVFIVIESLFLAMKKTHPHGWFAHHQASFTWFYVLIAALWTVGITIESVIIFFGDQGFGWGFNVEFQTGWHYQIPVFVLSLIIQLTYLWLATWYVHWHLAKRGDFLTNQYWKHACVVLLTVGIMYIPVALFKAGFRRVYYYNVIFGDILQKLQVDNPDRFAHYMGQTKFNYGFNPYNESLKAMLQNPNFWGNEVYDNQFIYNLPDLNYAWYKPFGFFATNPNPPKAAMPKQSAFPSGHMAATFGIGLTVYIFKDDHDKKVVLGRKIGLILGILYAFDMLFALEVSLSHWWSDSSFTMFWLGPSMLIAWAIVQTFDQKLLPKINRSLSQSK